MWMILSQKKINRKSEAANKLLWMTYKSLLTASGLAFSYVYKNNFSHFKKTDYYLAFNDDKYIKYVLNFGKCNYRIITSDDGNLAAEIIASINRNIPVLSEGLFDSSWCLITGYSDTGKKLFGYSSRCSNCESCTNCVDFKVDGYFESDMFYKSNWEKSMKKIIIIDDFKSEPYDYKIFIKHWISMMQHDPQNGFVFGEDAYNAMIELLENDELFSSLCKDDLYEVYKLLFTNSYIPECRHFVAEGLGRAQKRRALREHMGLSVNAFSETQEKLDKVVRNGFSAHDVGWKYWEVLSDRKEWHINPEKYAEKIISREVREKAIKEIIKIKELDDNTFKMFNEILLSEI